MGRKRGLPRSTREKVVAEEAAQAMDEQQRDELMQNKPNDALFVVDSRGSGRKRAKLQKEARDKKVFSKNEKKIVIQKYLGKKMFSKERRPKLHDPWEDEVEQEGSAPASGTGGDLVTTKTGGGGTGAGMGSNDPLVLRTKPGKSAKRTTPTVRDMAKLGVCHPGQSYNPTEEDHQDVLASAVAVELRREEALADEKKPISQGMSNETLAVLVGDEDDESSDEDEGGDDLPSSIGQKTPATGKLTRTQRNKLARKKQAMYEQAAKRRKKNLHKSIDDIAYLETEVAEQERLREERRKTKRLLKAQKAELEAKGAAAGGVFGPSAGIAGMGEIGATAGRVDNRDIIAGRSVPVNLSEELHGSLRQLRTQGSVLLDKVELLKANKAHPDKRRAKERAKKAPKGFRKKHKFADRYKDD